MAKVPHVVPLMKSRFSGGGGVALSKTKRKKKKRKTNTMTYIFHAFDMRYIYILLDVYLAAMMRGQPVHVP